MAQTIKQTGQAVARAIGIDPPNSFFGNTEDTAARLLQAMRDAGRALARRDWVALQFEHTFTTVSGTTDYALPTNPVWHHMVPGTDWDRTNFSRMQGSQTAREWQRLAGETMLTTSFFARPWRLRVDAGRSKVLSFVDDPAGAYDIAYEYVTDAWAFDGSNLYYQDITADTNQPVFDDYLFEMASRWRAQSALGLPYQESQLEAIRLENMLFGQERGRDVLLSTKIDGASHIPDANWPDRP